MFRQDVKLKDGFVKTVVADSEEELAEGVAAVKNDSYPVSPDLHDPKEPNAVVSPENLAVEPPYVQPVELELADFDLEVEPVVEEKPKKASTK